MSNIRIGLVGCGGISEAHGTAVQGLGGLPSITACCDINFEAAREWSRRYGPATPYPSMEAMLASEDLDGVLLATWPNLHRRQIEECIDAGISNILCEKALTLTGAEAAEIHSLAASTGTFILEGFMYRHHPATAELERQIAAGKVGEVDYVRAAFSNSEPETASGDNPNRNWRYRKECAGGVPFDYACYAVNACGHFAAGVPVTAAATGSVSEAYDIVDRLFGIVGYSNGRTGIVESSKKSSFDQELRISGSEGVLTLPLAWTIAGDTEVVRSWSTEWNIVEEERSSVAFADPYALQLRNFARVIAGDSAPRIPLVQSVVNTYVIDALIRSVAERRTIEILLPAEIEAEFRTVVLGEDTRSR